MNPEEIDEKRQDLYSRIKEAFNQDIVRVIKNNFRAPRL